MIINGTELKASIVLQAMVTGLLKSKDDPDFVVKMETFGKVKNNLCYGCCATLTLVQMFGKGQSASEIMLGYVNNQTDQPNSGYAHLADVVELEPSSGYNSLRIKLLYLESAVEMARRGDVSSLIKFLTGESNKSFNDRWCLDNENWEEQLPVVNETIAEMIAAGY